MHIVDPWGLQAAVDGVIEIDVVGYADSYWEGLAGSIGNSVDNSLAFIATDAAVETFLYLEIKPLLEQTCGTQEWSDRCSGRIDEFGGIEDALIFTAAGKILFRRAMAGVGAKFLTKNADDALRLMDDAFYSNIAKDVNASSALNSKLSAL